MRATSLWGAAGVVVQLAVVATIATAQSRSGPDLIDPATLRGRLAEPGLVLLHVGQTDGFASRHIEGARPVSLADLSTPRGSGRLTLQLPPVDVLQATLSGWGITDDSTVVVYAAMADGVTAATRVVFTLDAVGLGSRTLLLDGGLPAWVAAGQPTASGAAPASASAAGGLALSLRPAVASFVDVRRASAPDAPGARTVVLDARTDDFYSGANDRRGAIPRPGHVPGAVNLPFDTFVRRATPGDESSPLVLKTRSELEAMFAAAGITRDTPLITYCHIGQQATVPYLAARLLGFDVRLYDGSFEEWSADATVPVDKR